MNVDDQGGPAFPTLVGADMAVLQGMKLRDWFAGQALVMAGAIVAARSTTNPEAYKASLAPQDVAELAYVFADAMLKARAK